MSTHAVRSRYRAVFAILVLAALLPARVGSAEPGSDTGLPRFECLVWKTTDLLNGPKPTESVIQTFDRQHLPLLVIREFGTWRYVRDPDGVEGWLQDAKLQRGQRFVMVRGGIRVLHEAPAAASAPLARLEPNVLAKLERCPADQPDWCEVRIDRLRGWLSRADFWGTNPGEIFPAP